MFLCLLATFKISSEVKNSHQAKARCKVPYICIVWCCRPRLGFPLFIFLFMKQAKRKVSTLPLSTTGAKNIILLTHLDKMHLLQRILTKNSMVYISGKMVQSLSIILRKFQIENQLYLITKQITRQTIRQIFSLMFYRHHLTLTHR